MRIYDLFQRINDNSRIAKAFNDIFDKLDAIRICSAPSIFEQAKNGEQVSVFFETCLWETYLHSVVSKLNRWGEDLDEYFNEFEGSWKYYAASRRIESLQEGFGDDKDYNEDGSIKKDNLTDEDLTPYSIIGDLVFDDWRDIVQDTTREQLYGLCGALQLKFKVSLTDVIKSHFGTEIQLYKQDENGNMVPMSFADKVLSKVQGEVDAEGYSAIVIVVCDCMQEILSQLKSFNRAQDNKDALQSIRRDIGLLLELRFEEMNIVNKLLNR